MPPQIAEAVWEDLPPGVQVEIPFKDTEVDSATIANIINLINRLEEAKLVYEKQKEEAGRFYDKRTASADATIAVMEGRIRGYLEFNKQKSISTHRGTAYLHTYKKKIWPGSDILITWIKNFYNASNSDVPEGLITNGHPTVSHKKLSEMLATVAGEVSIPGYSEEQVSKLIIRKPNEIGTVSNGIQGEGV